MDNRKISIAIPTYNRFEMTIESFEQVLNDSRVNDVTIVDDCSTDGSYEKLVSYFENSDKVFIRRNQENLDCYINKATAVRFSVNTEWCILFDSDNILTVDYLDKLYAIPKWKENTVYAPVFAEPHFDYRKFEGLTIMRENVKSYVNDQTFLTALNTANYFIHRDSYLKAFDPGVDPVTADSIYMAYRLLDQDNTIHFVSGLTYKHRVHTGSHYQNNNHRTGNFYEQTLQKLRQLS